MPLKKTLLRSSALFLRRPTEPYIAEKPALEAPKPLVISGPSGVGKSTLINKLSADFPNLTKFSVSHTSRQIRPKEIDGVHYHFSNEEFMKAAIQNDEFIEYACFAGNMYGTSYKTVEETMEAGKVCILDLDLQGVKSMKICTDFDANYVFIAPKNYRLLVIILV